MKPPNACRLFRVHRIDLLFIILVQYATLDLQRVGELAFLHREVVRQQGEAFDLLIMGQLLLQGVDALFHHVVDLLVGTQLLAVLKGDVMFTGILF